MNRVILIGRIGKDPESRTSGGGTVTAKTSLATDGWANGEKKTDWHNLVLFDKNAENLMKYKRKGDQIAVEGRVSYRSWDKDDGSKGYITEIVVDRLEFIGGGQGQGDGQSQGGQRQSQGNSGGYQNAGGGQSQGGGNSYTKPDDDLPF